MPSLSKLCAVLVLGFAFASAYAQGDGITGVDTTTSTTTTSTTTGAMTAAPGEIGVGINQASTKLGSIIDTVITSAVTLSQTLKPEADKFAGALAVITIILAGVRFSASHHPVAAWVELFEELGMFGIFATFYLGYTTCAPTFYNWFSTMAGEIAPKIDGQFGAFGASVSDMWDGVVTVWKTASVFDIPSLIPNFIPVLLACVVMLLTSVVVLYFTHLGAIQSSVGIVVGQIAFALGFSSYTRGYFKNWLNYMINSGMYIVVSAILISLVGKNIAAAMLIGKDAFLTNQGAAMLLDLSLFVFLLSFEIPKMASLFGGGGGVSGGAIKGLKALL